MRTSKTEAVLRDLFDAAGITIDGNNPWDIHVHDSRFYQRVLNGSELGLGESYMDGWWDCEAVDQAVSRILLAGISAGLRKNFKTAIHLAKARFLNRQSRSRSFQVGERHYDLGNDLYEAMLDRRMNYTCAYWRDARNLEEAQEAKLDLVCRKTGLKPGVTVLDLGCGWGAFAKYAAEKYGVSVTGVTVSRQQVSLGRELCRGLPVILELRDYREVEGSYDRVISIGIMEHVGYRNYRTYMEAVNRTLKDGGISFFHTIGGNVSARTANAWTDRYIFPNGMLPSISQLGKAMEGLFVMEDWHNIGPHYDPTLMAWNANFEAAWPELKKNYDERFRRMWRFYLLSSAGSFRARSIQLWQVVMTRPGTPQPACRLS